MTTSMIAALVTIALSTATAGAADRDAAQTLMLLGFPRDTTTRVAKGELVETALPPSSPRDLNVGLAFLVKTSPERLTRELFEELVLQRVDPAVIGYGRFTGDGTNTLTKLQLTPAQQEAYAAAAPGDALNLSTDEIAAIRAAGKDPAAIWNALRDALIARYNAYRTKGLKGIAPYARTGGTTSPADELAGFNTTARATGVLPASVMNLLDGYPPGTPPPLTEAYTWSQFTAHGTDTVALVHAWVGTFGQTLIGVQRQYYASAGYNAEQAIAGFLPVTDGTLVIYTNHTSTDQVTGVGGGVKRSIGRTVLAAELQKLFTKLNAAVEK